MEQRITVELADVQNKYCNCCEYDVVSDKYFKVGFATTPTTTTVMYLCERHLRELALSSIAAIRKNC